MNLKDMTVEELEARMAAIPADLDKDDADLDALEAEARGIKEELEARKAAEAQRREIREQVAVSEQKGQKIMEETRNVKTLEEIRSSKEYVNAYAEYIKTGKDAECRKLLSENTANPTDGSVPVPTIVEGRIRTAWEKAGVMDIVRKTFIRGNVKVGYEVNSSPAVVHGEGTPAPDEEILDLDVANLIPQSIKKWITISDEALDLSGEEFLDYMYDELAYRIAQKAQEVLLQRIIYIANNSGSGPAVTKTTVAQADMLSATVRCLGSLSGEAANPVIVTTRATWAGIKAAAISANYAVDPFEGLPVYFVSQTTLSSAVAIVGDFGYGAMANFPNGAEIQIKKDELSLAEKDLVKLVGRQYVALDVVAPNAFTVAYLGE